MSDAIDPSHYKAGWSDDAELISVTENLTGNGAQAVQYVARSTRLDESLNKSEAIAGRIEDLEKALWFISREVKRLKRKAGVETVTVPIRDYQPLGRLAGDINVKVSPQCDYTISKSQYGHTPDTRLLDLINGAAFGRDGKIVR